MAITATEALALAFLEGERQRVIGDISAMRERISSLEPIAGKAFEAKGFRGRVTSLAELRRQARQEGYAEGYAAGYAAALEESATE